MKKKILIGAFIIALFVTLTINFSKTGSSLEPEGNCHTIEKSGNDKWLKCDSGEYAQSKYHWTSNWGSDKLKLKCCDLKGASLGSSYTKSKTGSNNWIYCGAGALVKGFKHKSRNWRKDNVYVECITLNGATLKNCSTKSKSGSKQWVGCESGRTMTGIYHWTSNWGSDILKVKCCDICVNQAKKKCDNGNVYWYDSCGNKGEKKKTCECGCTNGKCKECCSEKGESCSTGDCCSGLSCYEDKDGDQYSGGGSDKKCHSKPMKGNKGDDCDDSNKKINPGATENCGNKKDDNCNDKIDCEDSDCPSDLSCGKCKEAKCNINGNYQWSCQSVETGTSCGDCKICNSAGECVSECEGTEKSCECKGGSCIDCSNHYGTSCGYEDCNSSQSPQWSCSSNECDYNCKINVDCLPDECDSDSECDDGNPCTKDVCNNPDSPTSTCSFPAKEAGQYEGCQDTSGCSPAHAGSQVCACDGSKNCNDSCGDGACQSWEDSSLCPSDCKGEVSLKIKAKSFSAGILEDISITVNPLPSGSKGEVNTTKTLTYSPDKKINLTAPANPTTPGWSHAFHDWKFNGEWQGASYENRKITVTLSSNSNATAWYESTSEENNAPTADFTKKPTFGYTYNTEFKFNASKSSDEEDPKSDLKVRWDFQNDSNWDTSWSTSKMGTHTFGSEGTKNVKLQVKDTEGAKDSIVKKVHVLPSGTYLKEFHKGWNSVYIWHKGGFSFNKLSEECENPAGLYWGPEGGLNTVDPDQKFQAGEGYLIRVKEECKVPLEDSKYTKSKLNLSSGWNLNGATKDITHEKGSSNCKNIAIMFIKKDESLGTVNPGGKMKAGEGYLIRVKEDCQVPIE